MSKLHIGWIALAGVGFAAILCLAIYLLFTTRLENTANLRSFESQPAKAIMSQNEFKYYTKALDNLDCDLAGILLNTAFIRRYPQFKRARLNPECRNDQQCLNWSQYSEFLFDEYGFCKWVSKFNEAKYEIRILKLAAPKFDLGLSWQGGVRAENHWVESRNISIELFITLANADYIPALLKIGELLRRGDIFILSSNEAEYFLLTRACFLGYDLCAELEPRLAELRETLAADRIALVETTATTSSLQPLLLDALLVSGTLSHAPLQVLSGIAGQNKTK